ncbi:uncharacterized protein PV09_09494 [Verruconis gallopava]|uniref:Uncharacterized protein n=1 Tax=Verruconis gallopava TaxID=253628 RepID=A0A0D1ZW71_9PEZI|nr:uncharacterized protein PV09_09494 [Verruconis gallopava]KIV98742.1 hypothetical protein PV09_09494 [Verruconis gallopava]
MQNYVTLQSWTQNGSRESWIVEDDGYLPSSDSGNNDASQVSPCHRDKVAALYKEELRRIAQKEQDIPTANVALDDLALTTNWMPNILLQSIEEDIGRAAILEQENKQDTGVPSPIHAAAPLVRSTRTASGMAVSYLQQPSHPNIKLPPITSQLYSLHDETEQESKAEWSDDAHLDSDFDGFEENDSEDSVADEMFQETCETIVQSVESPSDDKLADAVGKLSAFLCTEEFLDSRASSTFIVSFSGLISFPYPGSTFKRPQNYTPKLSALIYCICLCLLEATIPRYAHPLIGWQARPHTGLLSRFNPVRERFMCLGCQALMGELLSLRSYGRAISRSDGPTFRVQWSDDSQTVCWDAGKDVGSLTMDQLRQFGRKSTNSASVSLTRLMYGWVPDIHLKGIRDMISNQKKGYSFVQEPANKLNTAYLDLSSRACLDLINGLIKGDQWNMAAVRRYLQEEVEFLIQMMLVMYLLGGQAPRSPDLFSIEHRNGESTSRGTCVHDGVVVYIIQHWKARQATNKEFNVAWYLTPDASKILATYLIYVRPFTDILCRVCLQYQHEHCLLFVSPEHPEKPWKVGVLTNALKTLSKAICGTSFRVQVYRQLSIAVTEKYIKQISKPFNRYDDKSVSADIEVAFSWQSGHRPLQRGTTYGIDGAFPDSLQPALLRIYKWASCEWQGFMRSDNIASSSPESRHESVSIERLGDKRRTPPVQEEREAKRRHSSGLSQVVVDLCQSDTLEPGVLNRNDSGDLSLSPVPIYLSNMVQVSLINQENTGSDDKGSAWARWIQARKARRKHMQHVTESHEVLQTKSVNNSEIQSARDTFSYLGRYGLIVCKGCKYAVWPSEVGSHLSSANHRMPKIDRQRIQQEIMSWKGLVTSINSLELPNPIPEVIPELSLYDGLLCTLEKEKCKAVARTQDGLRKHWGREHKGWTFEKFNWMIEEATCVINGEAQYDGEKSGMKIEFSEYESALVYALAVLGVSETGWRGPDSYPPILLSVIKCARFMVVQKAVHMAGGLVENEHFTGRRKMDLDKDSGLNSNDTASLSLLSSIQLRSHGRSSSLIIYEPASLNRFRWASSSICGWSSPGNPSSPAIEPRGRPQTCHVRTCLDIVNDMMDQFMVRGTKGPMQWMLDLRTYGLKIYYNTTRSGHVEWCNGDELLYKKAQFNMAQFRSMLHGLIKQMRQIMFNELLFCGGKKAKDIPNVPWNTIRDDPTNTTPGWSFLDDERTRLPVNVEKYMASIAQFREKLLVAAHITGGQPARGTEILSIRYSNIWKGGHRNVFIEDGLVVFVTKYHKGYALSGDVKVIHRYLPREIGELVVWYLWLVRPFERWLQSIIGGQYKEGVEEDHNSESKASRLFCHDGNGREWTSGRMRQALERATAQGLGYGLHIQAYRDIAIGEEGEGDAIEDLQAGYGSHIAGMVYARGLFEMDGAIASRRQQFRTSSIDWHRFLAFPSAMDMNPV